MLPAINSNSHSQLKTLVRDIQYIHGKVGLEMHKFRSNSLHVADQLGETMEQDPVNLSFDSDTERVSSDFSLKFSKLSEDLLKGNWRPTKRGVLRTLMTILVFKSWMG